MPAPIRIVGDLPPPAHGQAHITEAVVARLRARDNPVVHDVAPAGARRAGRLRAAFEAGWAVATRPARHLYMPVLAGRGMALTVALAAAARLRRVPVTLHHHSYAYLDRRWRGMALLARAAGPSARHVALCEGMATRLTARYGVRRPMVVPNAAFVARATDPPERILGPRPCLGFVGALTRAKGLDTFLALARWCAARHDAVAAGPVPDADARACLDAARRELGDRLTHRPPGDPGTLYAGIDVLILPSRYRHEAQPLVVLEALARGIPVIARGVGCLPGMARPPALTVLPPDTEVVPAAARVLDRLTADPNAIHAARALHAELAETAAPAADRLVAVLRKSTSA